MADNTIRSTNRTPAAAAAMDTRFSGHSVNTNPSSPYKYDAYNSPLKDFQRTDGSYGNYNNAGKK